MKKHFFILIFFFFAFAGFGQARKTVGIVLSGGGAKGFAHIGVLRVLDSLEIPIDYIGGTSMGGIVGGLTAIGYSPDQIQKEVLNADWNDLLDQKPKRKHLKLYEKQARERYFLTVEMSKSGKIEIPGGINNGQKITSLFSKLTYPYHGNLDFSKDLEIPFLCISTELNSGNERVLNHGELYQCLRATMSIPSLFSPYKLGGKYMIDGGTVNNFPADHIKELGADLIIGIDVQTTFSDTVSDPTLLKVLEKTGMYVNAKTTKEREKLCDLIIKPNMKGFSVTSFEKGLAIIKEGERAARRQMTELLKLKSQLGNYRYRKHADYHIPDSVKIKSIEIKGLRNVTQKQLLGTLDLTPGKWYSEDEINYAMQNVYGSGWFNNMEYAVSESEILTIDLEEKESLADIRLGLRYDPDYKTTLLLNLTTRQFLLKGSSLSLDLGISENPRARLLYFWDNGSKPGFGMAARYINYQSSMYLDEIVLGRFRQSDLLSSIFVSSLWSNNTTFQAGGELHLITISSDDLFFNDIFQDQSLSYVNAMTYVSFQHDNRDRANYGTKGSYFKLKARAYFIDLNTSDYNSNFPLGIRLDWIKNYKFSDRYSQSTDLTLGATLGTLNLYPYTYNLGGLGQNYVNQSIPFYGYRFNQNLISYFSSESALSGNQLVKLAWNHQFEIFKNNFIKAGMNGALVFDDYEAFARRDESKLLGGFLLEYGVNTMIGPVSIATHKSFEYSRWLGYINIGFWF